MMAIRIEAQGNSILSAKATATASSKLMGEGETSSLDHPASCLPKRSQLNQMRICTFAVVVKNVTMFLQDPFKWLA